MTILDDWHLIIGMILKKITWCCIALSIMFLFSCEQLVVTTSTSIVTTSSTVKLSSYQLSEQAAGITDAKPYQYFLYSPDTYSNSTYPLIIFLHGAGERGDPLLNKVINHGPLKPFFTIGHTREQILDVTSGEFNNLNDKVRGSFVVAPQCRNIGGSNWWQPAKLKVLLDDLLAQYPTIDQKRIYITGLSMGGGGSWDFARLNPGYIAALMPICGAASVGHANLLGIPTWTFHSFGDGTVGLMGNTVEIIDESTPGDISVMSDYPHVSGNTNNAAVSTQTRTWSSGTGFSSWTNGTGPASGRINLTVYTDSSHDSWTRSYSNGDVWDWLFSHTKP